MPKTKISEFSATPANNTDIDSINIAEGCAPSGINDAIRELMAQLKDFQTGAVGDSFNGPIGTSTAAAGAFTTLSASSTVSGTGFSTYLASPPAIGGTAAAAGAFTSLTASTTLGVTGVSTLTGGAVVQGLTVGRGAGANSANTAVGLQALNANTSGSANAAVGYAAMQLNTTGGGNSAFGYLAVQQNTTGTNNTGIGDEALRYNTTASNNTAVGYQAGYSTNTGANNAFLGYQAGYGTTSGYQCTALGANSLKANVTNLNCTAVGYEALLASTANSNTAIGQGAGSLITTGYNHTLIGRYNGNQGGLDIRTSSNYIVLSDGDGNPRGFFDNTGCYRIGTADAAGTSGVGVAINPNSQGIRLVSAASTNASETFAMYSTGATAYRFYVNWAGTVYATSTTISSLSDVRLKENVRDLDAGLPEIMALKPRKFDWKEGKGANVKNARGFIAQEFETVFPDLIDQWKDPVPEGEEPYKSVRADLIPVLVKAIQELKAEIDQLKGNV